MGRTLEVDHVWVRRESVDYGFLDRATDGSTYRVTAGDPVGCVPFAAEVDAVDPVAAIDQRESELAAKRAAHMGTQ